MGRTGSFDEGSSHTRSEDGSSSSSDQDGSMRRYRSIIDDWDAFVEACEEPAQTTVRRNPLKAHDDFDKQLRNDFDTVNQADWNRNIYRLPGVESPGKSMLHWRGEYYVQEESAAVPVTVLDPQPGERILDIAAAPGGKATQIAAHMENTGTLVANDANERRLQSLFANIYRTGAACAVVTNYEGQNLPLDDRFDRILVDAPCSGEGNECRRSFQAASDDRVDGLADLQKQIIETGVTLLNEGGTMVYSTCTFAPAENEGVVRHALDNTDLSIEPVDIDVPHQNGVKTFETKEYGDEMRETVRIYPHHMQSGGMYVAKLRK